MLSALPGGFGGELGHVPINFDGRACICGGQGCLKTYVSGTDIALMGTERLKRNVSATDVFRMADESNPTCQEVVTEVCRALRAGLAVIVNGLNPERVIRHGGWRSRSDRSSSAFTRSSSDTPSPVRSSRRASTSCRRASSRPCAAARRWSNTKSSGAEPTAPRGPANLKLACFFPPARIGRSSPSCIGFWALARSVPRVTQEHGLCPCPATNRAAPKRAC